MKFDETPLTSAAPVPRSLMPEIYSTTAIGATTTESPARFDENVVLAAIRLLERKSAEPTMTIVETAVLHAAAELFHQLAAQSEAILSRVPTPLRPKSKPGKSARRKPGQ
jgi:hypothetical protein